MSLSPNTVLVFMACKPGIPARVTSKRNRDLAFHLLGGSARELRDDLHGGRGRVGVGLHIDVQKGVDPNDGQSHRQQKDDQRVVERPLDEFANHDKWIRSKKKGPRMKHR